MKDKEGGTTFDFGKQHSCDSFNTYNVISTLHFHPKVNNSSSHNNHSSR